MKKIFLLVIGIFLFGFNLNQHYKCETLGFGVKRGNKIINIPNDIKTYKRMKKDLGNLYEVDFAPQKNSISLKVGNKTDILPYIESIKNKIDVYVTKDREVVVFVDKKVNQIAIKFPSKQMVIYYQCK